MGGVGSGRIRDGSSQTTIDDVNRINIYDLKKRGMLHPGTAGTISWSYGDRLSGSVHFRTFHDRLVLDYYSCESGDAWKPVEETIMLTWTSCHLGGKRPWFRCPGCNRRAAVLCEQSIQHFNHFNFLCRKCSHLPYASQERCYSERMMEQARKIRRRLWTSENLWKPLQEGCKPKGMRWRTYHRLAEREQRYNAASLSGLVASLEAFEAKKLR